MYTIEKHHYKVNRILLLLIGIWPYQKSILAKAQKFFVSSVLASTICIELITFITHDFNSSLIIDVLSYIFPTLTVAIKYYYFYIKREIMRRLLEHVQADWNSLQNKREREIIESYAENGRLITVVMTLFSCSVVFIYVTLPIALYVINIYLSHNNTYSLSLSQYVYIPIEYSVNQEKYIYVILLHFIIFLCITSIAIIAIATFIGLYLKHACGLLKIASYRIERAMNVENIQQISPLEIEFIMCVRVMRAIHIQQKALKFTDRVMSCFTIMYFILIIIGAVSVSLLMFRLLRVLQTDCDLCETFVTISVLIAHFLYMFIANNAAQEVSDHCNNLFLAAYNSTWYVAPLRVQKLILFLLQHGTKNFTIIVGGFFVGSLEGFATLLSTSLSYFMVIYSTQMAEEKPEK